MGYWKTVYTDENGRDIYYVPDDLNKAKNLSFVIRDFENKFFHVKKFELVIVKTEGGDVFLNQLRACLILMNESSAPGYVGRASF